MSGRITRESLDEVTSRTDIVSVVGEYVALTQKGNDWWGCCPFHNEKTPSFKVDQERKLYYCFGCHKGGNAIKFVQEMEKLDFPGAVERLAKKAGVTLAYEDGGQGFQPDDSRRKLRDEYIELYTRVSTSFHYFLMETEAGRFALDYIHKRGSRTRRSRSSSSATAPPTRGGSTPSSGRRTTARNSWTHPGFSARNTRATPSSRTA